MLLLVALFLAVLMGGRDPGSERVLAAESGATMNDGNRRSEAVPVEFSPAGGAVPHATVAPVLAATVGSEARERAAADVAVATRGRFVDGSSTDDGDVGAAPSASEAEDTLTVLLVGRSTEVSGCGEGFATAGEQLVFGASGFVANASVGLTARWASFAGGASHELAILAQTADENGQVSFSWSVPSVPPAELAPRAYAVQASGANPAGGTHTASMLDLLVAYPESGPCAAADAVSTSLGKAVQVSVLANDIAPSGGFLDRGSVEVRAAVGGVFSVDEATGVVSFVPEAGFWGTVETSYAV